ncbi:hypothetical protein ALC56_00795 [Trachymyrmex septentrionalis]|uniref:Uncharacterized protein n=1 Tax=Trachymyrmex septentrionalis TaxID=34720 RepID=A0A195FVX1_9HYME|nr:hypothetical protein ALC56_00795 [Trachymyrmex septentrionalis]
MSGNANRARTDDWNLTAGFNLGRVEELGNVTDELYPIPDYINVTSLADVNTTEEIDSFYFYEVSRISYFRFYFLHFCDRKCYKLYVVCNFWSIYFLIHRANICVTKIWKSLCLKYILFFKILKYYI